MLLNIEIKGPLAEEWVARYDYDLAVQKVMELMNASDVAHRVMISSFSLHIMESVVAASPPDRKYLVQGLRNRKSRPDPLDYVTLD